MTLIDERSSSGGLSERDIKKVVAEALKDIGGCGVACAKSVNYRAETERRKGQILCFCCWLLWIEGLSIAWSNGRAA